MKKILKKIFVFSISHEPTWQIMRILGLGHTTRVKYWRNSYLRQKRSDDTIKTIVQKMGLHQLKVRDGPFKNLKYASPGTVGSTLLPKLLGTYEVELHPIIDSLRMMNFPLIVDIGCAEGYYAVGLALLFQNSRVHAYDTNRRARKLCLEMAMTNMVADRVKVSGTCDKKSLLGHDFSGGGLVLSDCEGYEWTLFETEVATHLEKAHLIIELHDTNPMFAKERIEKIFRKTHNIQFIENISDAEKVMQYNSELIDPDDLEHKRVAFSEFRGHPTPWAVIYPK